MTNASSLLKFILYADDTTLLMSDKNINTLTNNMNAELIKVNDWFHANKLTVNVKKTCAILFGPKILTNPKSFSLNINNQAIDRVPHTKFLGIIISSNLSWSQHITSISLKISKNIGIIYRLKQKLPKSILHLLYQTLILPYLIYCIPIWGNSPISHLLILKKLQNKFIRIYLNLDFYVSISTYYEHANILSVDALYQYFIGLLGFKLIVNKISTFFYTLIDSHKNHSTRSLRSINNFYIKTPRTCFYVKTPLMSLLQHWNKLPIGLKSSQSLQTFKTGLKNLIHKRSFY